MNYRAGRTAKGVELAELARNGNPDLISPRILLALHYESEGRHDKAQTLVREILQVNPEITADYLAMQSGLASLFGTEDRDQLRRAGLP